MFWIFDRLHTGQQSIISTMAENIEYSATATIAASPEKIWEAIVTPEKVVEYHLAPLLIAELKEGGRIEYGTKDETLISGTVLEVIENRFLKHTFLFGDRHNPNKDEETIAEYRIEPNESGATLTIRHYGFSEMDQTYTNVVGGWPEIIEGLEEYLTGQQD